MDKDVAKLARHLRDLGYQTKVSNRSGHVVVLDSAGNKVYALPKTPSDHRWYANSVRDMIRRGIITEDPKKINRRQLRAGRVSNGSAPPPLPVIGRPSLEAKGTAVREYVVMTHRLKDRATVLVQELQDNYGLKVRESRSVPHGTGPVLALIIEAYEKASGKQIPAFKYVRRYDVDDRAEIARLAANRVTDLVGSTSIGEHISPISVKSLEYSEAAVKWFKEDQKWEFPSRMVVNVKGRGIKVTHPAFVRDGAGAEDEHMGQEALREMGVYKNLDEIPASKIDNLDEMSATEWLTGEKPPGPDGDFVSYAKAKLAIEVAARIKNPTIAINTAMRVLQS